MRILGIDPGVHVGWCVVDVFREDFQAPSWVAHGVLHLDAGCELEVATKLSALAIVHGASILAVEDYARRFVSPKAAQQMIQAAQSCGMIRGLLTAWVESAPKRHVVAYPAHVWRKAIVGNGQAKDDRIEWALRELHHVALIPKRTNVHVRDACGLAIHAGREAMTERRETA